MANNNSDYDVYIFDLDGTLYDQPDLRRQMLLRLLGYYLLHPLRIRELFYLQSFRRIKDSWDECVSEGRKNILTADETGLDPVDIMICARVAKDDPVVTGIVAKTVHHWIYEEPLEIIRASKDDRLLDIIRQLIKNDKKVVIFSDYPVDLKLKALELDLDYKYSAADSRIGELKPSPKGINIIAEDLSADKSRMIMIGDRMEKDGKAAEAAGISYLILPRRVKKRLDYYRRITDG